MNQNSYIGHNSQICGVEESILTRGKGKGMTLLNVRNGKGLNLTFSADRAMDISRRYGIFKILYRGIFNNLRFDRGRKSLC